MRHQRPQTPASVCDRYDNLAVRYAATLSVANIDGWLKRPSSQVLLPQVRGDVVATG